MIQKNLELQLQALKMIEQKYGLTPAPLMQGTGELIDDELPMEELLQTETYDNWNSDNESPYNPQHLVKLFMALMHSHVLTNWLYENFSLI